MEGKDSLHADAACDSSNSEIGRRAGTILAANHYALEGLHALPVPLADAEVNPHGIPRAKNGKLGAIFRFDQLRCIHTFNLLIGFQWGRELPSPGCPISEFSQLGLGTRLEKPNNRIKEYHIKEYHMGRAVDTVRLDLLWGLTGWVIPWVAIHE